MSAAPPRRALDVGRVLGTSLGVWASNAGRFVLFALVVMLPHGMALRELHRTAFDPDDPIRYLLAVGATSLVRAVAGSLLAAVVIGAVVLQLRGQRYGFGATVAAAVGRVPAVAAVAVTQAALYVACFVPATAFAALRVAVFAVAFVLVGAVVLGGVYCGVYVAVPAAVAERPGVFGAVGRSWRLTRGSRLRIFVIAALFLAAASLASAVAAGFGAVMTGPDWQWAWAYAASAMIASVEAVFLAVVYHDLRVLVDGVASDEIAAVFE